MKVFINKRSGGYSGGLIVVAANSAEEAHKVFHETAEEFGLDWLFDKYKDDDGSPVEYDYFYQKENWSELEGVTASGEPRILAEDGHSE